MLTIANCAVLLTQESPNYGPDDLETMRRAFRRACDENPFASGTVEQRGESHPGLLPAGAQRD